MTGVFLLGGLGADERHFEAGEDRASADGGAQGIAFVFGCFHANQDGSEIAALQMGEGTFGSIPEIHVEGGFQGDFVILEKSPIAVHDEETVAHVQSLLVDLYDTRIKGLP
jgi:hypothetical protein